MIAKLVVVGGDAKAAEVKLRLPTVIGRGRDVTLTLPHPLVSRHHCEIYEANGHLMVRDLGSLNGTFINSQRITEAVLPPGELLTVGTVTFRAVYTPEPSRLPPAATPAMAGGRIDETIALPPQSTVQEDADEKFDFPSFAQPAAGYAEPAGAVPGPIAEHPAAGLPVAGGDTPAPNHEPALAGGDSDGEASTDYMDAEQQFPAQPASLGGSEQDDDSADLNFLLDDIDDPQPGHTAPMPAAQLDQTIDFIQSESDDELPPAADDSDDDDLNNFFKGLR